MTNMGLSEPLKKNSRHNKINFNKENRVNQFLLNKLTPT